MSRWSLQQLAATDALAPALRAMGRGVISVFTLHRFANPETGIAGHEAAALRDHLAYLRRHRYRLLSLADFVAIRSRGVDDSTVPGVVFTVDDGYADFAEIGAPIFAAFDCPVTLFVTTGFLDGTLWPWWNRVVWLFSQLEQRSLVLELEQEWIRFTWSTVEERARVQQDVIRRLEWIDAPVRDRAIACLAAESGVAIPALPPREYAPLSWDDVRRLAGAGVTFGPHTVTHRILSLAPAEACDWEIRESCRRLRAETDATVAVLAYPNGGAKAFGQREQAAAQRAGLQAAVTTMPGYAVGNGDGSFALPRFAYPVDLSQVVHIAAGLARFTQRFSRAR